MIIKSNSLIMLSAVFFLSACSSAPSESEIKKAAVGDIDGVCKLATIDNFTKVNGVAGNGKTYQEEVKYTFNVLPFPDAEKILNDYENKYAEAKKAYETAKESADAVSAKFYGIATPEATEARVAASNATQAAFRVMDEGSTSNVNHMGLYYKQLVSQACPSASQELNTVIANVYTGSKEFFIGGAKKEIDETITLIKSDNGWVKGN